MDYPGLIKLGSEGPAVVEVKKKLVRLNIDQFDLNNDYYGIKTQKSVWEFQANATYDLEGKELEVNGNVDLPTWELFFSQVFDGTVTTSNKPNGIYSGPNATAPISIHTEGLTDFRRLVLQYAKNEVGTKEVGTNSGKRVNEYQRVAGLGAGNPWCLAFVLWCYMKSAEECGITINWIRPRDIQLMKTGHCQTFRRWAQDNGWVIRDARQAKPGDQFIMVFDDDKGHTGLIPKNDGKLFTIEGNTGSNIREGDGVYSKTRSYSSAPYIVQLPF